MDLSADRSWQSEAEEAEEEASIEVMRKVGKGGGGKGKIISSLILGSQ